MPTGVTTGLDVGLSNLSLKTITLSFYSKNASSLAEVGLMGLYILSPSAMCKSSHIVFVLLFAFAFHLERFSFRLIGVISLIFVGIFLMVATETHFVLSGFLLVLSASAFGALRWSLTELLLKNRKLGMDYPAAAIFWLAPVMGLTLASISMITDGWLQVAQSKFFEGWRASLLTTGCFVMPGVVAFCMILSEF